VRCPTWVWVAAVVVVALAIGCQAAPEGDKSDKGPVDVDATEQGVLVSLRFR
jgi:hypothetical protein